jgi:hypothetical protein
MSAFNWQCPFCGNHTTIVDARRSVGAHRISLASKHGKQVLATNAIACPNEKCRELYLAASLGPYEVVPGGGYKDGSPHTRWALRPEASAKVFPDYVPSPILEDYREACLIRVHSPKASATLARRCLQGMIRDFWGIRKNRLVDEVQDLQDKVDAKTWSAIDAVRQIGNVGAHMERDINLIVEVDPGEASLLIQLIETLINDWYVERHARSERMGKIIAAAASKKSEPP